MALTAAQVTSIGNSMLDFYMDKGKSFDQTIQAKPLIAAMVNGKTSFPGGKGNISLAVKGVYGNGGTDDALTGFTHDDTVRFYTAKNQRRVNYAWREMHLGLSISHTELKMDGLSVVDDAQPSMNGTTSHSKREMHVLVNYLKQALDDLGEQYARSLNTLLWGDGTADSLALAGIQHIIAANPTTGTVGGIDRSVAADSWWRNRARTAASGGAVTSSTANGGALLQEIQQEYRQLVRYGGRPRLALCGSDFLDAMETELRANGLYTQSGFDSGSTEFSLPALKFMGQRFRYDPTLDDLSLEKRMYWIDTENIKLCAMENEWNKRHTPARPADQFVMYRSITCTGQMVAKQCNSSLVMDIT